MTGRFTENITWKGNNFHRTYFFSEKTTEEEIQKFKDTFGKGLEKLWYHVWVGSEDMGHQPYDNGQVFSYLRYGWKQRNRLEVSNL